MATDGPEGAVMSTVSSDFLPLTCNLTILACCCRLPIARPEPEVMLVTYDFLWIANMGRRHDRYAD